MTPTAFCRRWCPTSEQLLILQELYRGGIHTPSRLQIQQITTRLSLYGKIEGKNVFYWFQNHKARERQKQRKQMLQKLQYQYLVNKLNAQAVQPQNHRFLIRDDQYRIEETKEPNSYLTYKKMIPELGESHEWVGLEISQANRDRKPLQTLNLFPVASADLKTEDEKDA